MGSKYLIKVIRLQNIKIIKRTSLVVYQIFWSHQHREALSTHNHSVLQWSYHDQYLNLSKGFGHPFWFEFTSFNKAFLSLLLAIFRYHILLSPICSCIHFQVWFYFTWPHLFYTKGVFTWDIITFVRLMHWYRPIIID